MQVILIGKMNRDKSNKQVMNEEFEDYYGALGVTREANEQEIKRAYHKMILRYHPDKNRDNIEECTQRFREIQTAYEILSNPQKRRMYDNECRWRECKYEYEGGSDSVELVIVDSGDESDEQVIINDVFMGSGSAEDPIVISDSE